MSAFLPARNPITTPENKIYFVSVTGIMQSQMAMSNEVLLRALVCRRRASMAGFDELRETGRKPECRGNSRLYIFCMNIVSLNIVF
jgi:hypothetical protein